MMRPSSFEVFALKFLQKSMMFTPCGPSAVPTGGAGVALPAWIWSFTIACTFFAMISSGPPKGGPYVRPITRRGRLQPAHPLNLLYLQKIQFDGRRAAEDRHHHLQRVLVEI